MTDERHIRMFHSRRQTEIQKCEQMVLEHRLEEYLVCRRIVINYMKPQACTEEITVSPNFGESQGDFCWFQESSVITER